MCETYTNWNAGCGYNGHHLWAWTKSQCTVQALVDSRGFVSVVHAQDSPTHTTVPHFSSSAVHGFFVPWVNAAFPSSTATGGCGPSCSEASQGACLCDVTIAETAVFTDPAAVPSVTEVLAQLSIASPPLTMYATGHFTTCTTQACRATGEVVVHLRAGNQGFTKETVFQVQVNGAAVYLKNVASTVSVDGKQFRNPPHFMPFHRPTNSPSFSHDAHHETEALLNHLFTHENTAPHTAHLLIQRLVTSNPSPRYVETVAEAFRTGSYGGRQYSGRYGDLAATVVAILMDREARSEVLDLDPTHGRLREPILKVLHFMRALEFTPVEDKEIELINMNDRVGQMYAQSPTVFNFYLPDYQPAGRVAQAGLVAPEAQLGTAPYLVGFLNGMASLVDHGLNPCYNGFGTMHGKPGISCTQAYRFADGHLAFRPSSNASADVVDELAMLLVGRPLTASTTHLLRTEFEGAVQPVQEMGPETRFMAPGCYVKAPTGCTPTNQRRRVNTMETVAWRRDTNG